MDTTALVTGATGFLGSHLTLALLARGYRVRALVRDEGRRLPDGVQAIVGDVTGDPRALDRAARDCGVVFHAAGAVGDQVTWERGTAVNREGTRRVALAARACRVPCLVHVSTVGVYGVDEGTYREGSPRRSVGDAYIDTKIGAEEALEEVFADTTTRMRILRPTMIYGPGDTGMMPRLAEMLGKRMPIIGDGQAHVGLVHVSDVVRAAVAAGEYMGDERVFNVSGDDDVTWEELATRLCEGLQLQRPRRMPRAVAMGIARIVQAASHVRLAPRPAPIRPNAVKLITEERRYPNDRMRTVLGVRPKVSVSHGLADAITRISSNLPPGAPETEAEALRLAQAIADEAFSRAPPTRAVSPR